MPTLPTEIITGCNVYIDELNMHLQLESWKLPKLGREMEDMMLGIYKTEMPFEISPLESEMECHGNPAAIRTRFGREPGDWTSIRYYEVALNASKRDGGPERYRRIVMMRGLLNEVDQPGATGAKAKDKTKTKWSSIWFYHDIREGRTVHKFDVFRQTLIIGGVNYTSERNSILAI